MAHGKSEKSSMQLKKSAANTAKSARKSRLADALRDNLRRRKAPTTPTAMISPETTGSESGS